MFVDTHAHINDEAFNGEIEDIIQNAQESGVGKIICSGNDVSTSRASLSLADKFSCVYSSVGIHPQDAFNESEIDEIKKLAHNNKVVAIGEIGLECHEGNPPMDTQKLFFAEQIKLAKSLDLPIIIHTRDAISDTLEVLNQNKDYLIGGTFHCFSESVEIAKEVLKLGFYISVGGVCTFKNAKKIKEVIEFVSLDRVLLETDCPYLSPEPFRGKRNEPANIKIIAQKVAEIKGITIEEVEKVTTENVRRLFNI